MENLLAPSFFNYKYLFASTLFLTHLTMDFISISFLVFFAFSASVFFFLCKSFSFNLPTLPLPPGSMGWPYVGETFQLYSQDPNLFFASKISRYGSIFKSHILGYPCVMISSPEAVKFVLNKADLFKPTFPASKERILGKHALMFHQGEYHSKLRRLVLRNFMPETIKHIVPEIESIAIDCLHSWENREITTFLEMQTFTFNVALLSILGKDEGVYREDLKRCYHILEKAYNSMPVNLPGTLFHKAMKARKELGNILGRILEKRMREKKEKEEQKKDLLGWLMEEKAELTEEQIADNVIGVIFAARDTTASVLTWIVKYLAENPSVLRAVTEEQEWIMKMKEEKGEEKSLKWEDTKKVTVTLRVIQETLRIATILPFTFREAVQDVEYEGYLIPKGWKILPLFKNIHHSLDYFTEPDKFNISRFEVDPKPNTYLPFGNGIHACPGNELAKLEILVLLHHLTTNYRWSMEGTQNGIQYGPFALPHNGLPITLYPKKHILVDMRE